MDYFSPPYLVVSANHDYRSKKRANIHFITDELAKRGFTTFLSTHSSFLSARLKKDRRFSNLSRQSVSKNGVECRLWKTLVHPMNVRSRVGAIWNPLATKVYAWMIPADIKQTIKAAQTIIIESGSAVGLIGKIRALNPDCAIIYNASDTLQTIGLAKYYTEQLSRYANEISHARLPSPLMGKYHSMIGEHRVIMHALDEDFFRDNYANPYGVRKTAVSVGSMLFDAEFFKTASMAFPEIDFYIIGSGQSGQKRENLFWLDEMPFHETIRYIKFADVGVAPYSSALASDYLIDTSMKLLQFEAVGIPAVCPNFVHGGKSSRFGYEVGDEESIIQAIQKALSSKGSPPKRPRTWKLVTDELLAR